MHIYNLLDYLSIRIDIKLMWSHLLEKWVDCLFLKSLNVRLMTPRFVTQVDTQLYDCSILMFDLLRPTAIIVYQVAIQNIVE
jgi:hypothetical protein